MAEIQQAGADAQGYKQNPLNDLLPQNEMACPGAYYDFGRPMFSHYPRHLHDEGSLSYDLSSVDPKGRHFFFQSHKCTGKSPVLGLPCNACALVTQGKQFQDLVKRSMPGEPVPPTMKTCHRTWSQLSDSVAQKNAQINALKLEILSLQRRMKTLSGRLSEQKRLMIAIAESDEVSVARIVQTALQNGAGVNTIVDRIVRAQQGLFSPRTYSQRMLDIAALVLKVGGPRLAFAVAKAMRLPSISTVRSHLKLPQLLPSIGFPTTEEINENIRSFFGSEETPAMPLLKLGLSLMIDEIAIEPRPRYSEQQDAVTGICREHAQAEDLTNMSTRSSPVDTLFQTKELLDASQCHRATEATMAAIACFGPSDYNACVILASATCKTEKAPKHSELLDLLLKSWQESPDGEARHGPI
ncbi:hypothetical protein FRC12_007946 [Ceratobasidium sp. 428]|nr:hypothetical protein FRC12_007946 [Ceratobasidium sp. 428]